MFEAKQLLSTKQSNDGKNQYRKFCPYVKIEHKGMSTKQQQFGYFRKVSSDRLFRVRNKQPFSGLSSKAKHYHENPSCGQ